MVLILCQILVARHRHAQSAFWYRGRRAQARDDVVVNHYASVPTNTTSSLSNHFTFDYSSLLPFGTHTAFHSQCFTWPAFTASAGVFTLGEVLTDNETYAASYFGAVDAVLDYPALACARVPCPSPPQFPSLTKDTALRTNAMVWPFVGDGIPTLYYGQEQGYEGAADPQNWEALWLSGFETPKPEVALVKALNAALFPSRIPCLPCLLLPLCVFPFPSASCLSRPTLTRSPTSLVPYLFHLPLPLWPCPSLPSLIPSPFPPFPYPFPLPSLPFLPFPPFPLPFRPVPPSSVPSFPLPSLPSPPPHLTSTLTLPRRNGSPQPNPSTLMLSKPPLLTLLTNGGAGGVRRARSSTGGGGDTNVAARGAPAGERAEQQQQGGARACPALATGGAVRARGRVVTARALVLAVLGTAMALGVGALL
ncbi:hypothetical protein B0H13DRAFT_2671799 [Mycena leptocephala]|nr:hypothetical protein B0H13DRAFT_2671799 [Mycena leptocephala]